MGLIRFLGYARCRSGGCYTIGTTDGQPKKSTGSDFRSRLMTNCIEEAQEQVALAVSGDAISRDDVDAWSD